MGVSYPEEEADGEMEEAHQHHKEQEGKYAADDPTLTGLHGTGRHIVNHAITIRVSSKQVLPSMAQCVYMLAIT